jgi:hypothetical protein
MADHSERVARLLVWAMYYATNGEPRPGVVPNLHDRGEAIAVAVDRGWMVDRGDGVSLTDSGRDLVEAAETKGLLIRRL